MTTRIKGLLHPKGEFGWAVGLLVVLPLLPLLIEGIANKTIDSSTVFLTATMYTVSHAFCAQRFWVLLVGTLCVAALLFCFGVEVANVPDSAEIQDSVQNSFTRIMYYISFAVMAFFGLIHIRQRWVIHVRELEPFFEFRHYEDR